MKTLNKAHSPARQKAPTSLILELDYNRKLTDFSKAIDEFKELKINKKEESVKSEEDDISILYYEDLELKEMINSQEFPEKEFNIVNNFLRVEEEENLMLNENSKNKGKKIYYENGSDDDGIVINQLNHKILFDEEFQPGLFTSFDFKDKIKSLVYNSFSSTNYDFNIRNLNLRKNIESSEPNSFSNSNNSELLKENEDKDGIILDLCLGDKDIESDNIIINFNDEIKEEEKQESSVSDRQKTNFAGFSKTDAIIEYENQIISFQNYYQIEQKEKFSNHPIVQEDVFDVKLFDYLANVSKIIQDKGLKNKIKLIIKLILYKDPETKKHIFNNREKNQLLLYWKNRYIKELEDATFKEKNKILQQKLESFDPNNKIIEMSIKRRIENRKSQTRNRSIMYNSLRRSDKFHNSINQRLKKIDNKSSKNLLSKK